MARVIGDQWYSVVLADDSERHVLYAEGRPPNRFLFVGDGLIGDAKVESFSVADAGDVTVDDWSEQSFVDLRVTTVLTDLAAALLNGPKFP